VTCYSVHLSSKVIISIYFYIILLYNVMQMVCNLSKYDWIFIILVSVLDINTGKSAVFILYVVLMIIQSLVSNLDFISLKPCVSHSVSDSKLFISLARRCTVKLH
jgi:hypothetical protein